MATILLLDESPVAGRALRGILARGNHGCISTGDVAQAWRQLRDAAAFDLVIVELKLGGGGGLAFLQRLRADWFWKSLPLVVYTTEEDPVLIKRTLELNVQNYLLKPYDEALIHLEIARALSRSWRSDHFEAPGPFCAAAGISVETLRQRRRELGEKFSAASQSFPQWAEQRQNAEVFGKIDALIQESTAAGVRIGVEFLQHLRDRAAEDHWVAFVGCDEIFEFASRLIFCELNPSYAPDCSAGGTTLEVARTAAEQERWLRYDVVANGPILKPEGLKKEIDGLAGCPVTSSSAAAFQMVADGKTTRMSQMMDLAANDPGLAAQVLAAANRGGKDDMDEIEDPQAAATQLGEKKLGALARTFPIIPDEHFDVAPFNWAGFWLFQATVARVAPFVCSYLEFDYLAGNAATAGLLHDVGRMLLLKLHPFALPAILRHAREQKVPVADAERRYLGCTTRELATHFAETQHLPSSCRSVIRWFETPALATKDIDLIAIVSVARQICLLARVGCSIDAPVSGGPGAISSTAAWSLLQPRLFPSFDLRKFEVQAHAFCLTVRNELSGRIRSGRPSHAQRAAELV